MTGRFSNVTDTFTIIVANREWVSSHGKRLTIVLVGASIEMSHICTTRTYLANNRERERGPIVSVGVDPTGTSWQRLATFDVYDQITIATTRQTKICPSCELPINVTSMVLDTTTTLAKKKNHLRDSRREERCSTCDIMLDQARSAQGKSRGQSRIGPCPGLIAWDRAWYHTWNSVLLAANLKDGSFFCPG